MPNNPLRKSASALALLIFCLVLGAAPAWAQSTTQGAIGGTVKDPQGAVVANAPVTVKNEETNQEVAATTDDEGRFRVVQLDPGNYTVTISASGFAAFSQQKVVVEVGRVTPLDISLTVGGAQETVEVTSEAPVINADRQDFSTNINQVSINNLPTNGRRWSNFALLTPGAVPDGSFGLVSFRGVSGLLNNSTVDGGDNNQAFFSEERGRTRLSYSISQDSVREFQVNTSNYSAEYGRAAGGVVNAVTKSGTNEFHGNVFFYVRDDKFNARNPQLPTKTEDNRKQFGGTIGGPIVKDRLFFFFSYDQQKRNFPGISTYSANTFNTTNFNNAALLTRGLTQGQIDQTKSFLDSLTGPFNRRGDQTLFLPKVDWRINNSNSLAVTYNRLRWNSPNGVQTSSSLTRATTSIGDDLVDVDWITLRLTSTITPNFINEGRFQYGRDWERQVYPGPLPGEPTTAPPGGVPPQMGLPGFTLGKPNFLDRRSFPDEKRWQYADTMTLLQGNHAFKFGFDINHVKDVNDNLFTESGSYVWSTTSDFFVDYANFLSNNALRAQSASTPTTNPLGRCVGSTRRAGQCYNGTFNQGFGTPKFTFSTNDWNFFLQDDWRVSPNLTVNLGLRYEYQQLPEPQIPNAAFDADTRFAAKTGVFPADKNNWGPRFGFAYNLTGNTRNVIRGGYGVYFGRIQNSVISNAITNTGVPEGQVQLSLNTVVFPQAFNSASEASGGSAPIPNIVVFSPDMSNPTIHQADLIFEHELTRNTVVSASYIMSAGRNLTTFRDINAPEPTATTTIPLNGGPLNGQSITVPRLTGNRINNNFNFITQVSSDVESSYHALVLQFNRRYTNGLQFQTNYTLSKAEDFGQSTGTFTSNNLLLNPYDLGLEEGPANFDVRHRFVASAVWTPEFFGDQSNSKVGRAVFDGFNFAPVFVIQSGFPYSIGITGTPTSAAFGPAIIRAGSNLTGSGATGRVGERNSLNYPKFWNFDLRISRRFRIRETMNFEVVAESFNLFNRTHVIGNLDTVAYTIDNTNNRANFSPSFQTIQPPGGETLYKARQFQFALRFEF
ncbi:MAG TPA: TonB-dependent receptor [Pyrinomonadaceae bacterium]|nr:TonB-dependent receptor [Pyrinomonadaceae bacterium]